MHVTYAPHTTVLTLVCLTQMVHACSHIGYASRVEREAKIREKNEAIRQVQHEFEGGTT